MALFLSCMRLSWRVYCVKGSKFGVSKDGVAEELTESMRDWKVVHCERIDSLTVNRVEVEGRESMSISLVAISVRDSVMWFMVVGGGDTLKAWMRYTDFEDDFRGNLLRTPMGYLWYRNLVSAAFICAVQSMW
jgi:hypothetical protein